MHRLRLAAAAALIAACSTQPPHVNPFDPQSPPSAQARATLAGTFTLEASRALAGTHVSLLGTGLSADTAADGAYSISGVSPGTWSVQGSRDGYRSAIVSGIVIRLEDGDQTVTAPAAQLQVARGAIGGRVQLEGESFHGGTTVSAAGLDGATLTDAMGNFVLDRVPAGTWTVNASRIGFEDKVVAGVQVADGQVTAMAAVTLPARPGGISGTVTLEGRTDFSGVTLSAAGVTLAGATVSATARSDAQGKFALAPLPAGTYNVTCAAADYATQTAAATISPAATTSLAAIALIRQRGAASGNAMLAGAASSAGIAVTLMQNSTAVASVQTAPGGNWRADSVPVGAYAVAYERPGYQSASGAVTIVAQDVAQVVPVVLSPLPATVTGKALLEAGGSDLSGTLVAIEGTSLSTQTLADGSWSLSGAILGTRTVAFQRSGYEAQRAQIAIGPGETLPLLPVTLALSRGAIAGAFQLAGAASSAGVVVSLQTTSFSTVTDAAGAFGFSGVPVGTYTVAASKPAEWQGTTVSGVLVVRNGTTALPGTPVTLQPVATANISGAALLELEPDASGTTVTLTGQDFRGVTVSLSTSTGASGAWSFDSLRAGSYQATLAHASFDSAPPIGISVVTGQTVSLGAVTLAASRGAVTGTVTAAGAANQSGTVVTVSGGPDSASTVTDGAGRFRLDRLRVSPGYVASFSRTAYAPAASGGFAINAGATTSLSPAALSLATDGSISGSAAVERPAGANGGIAVSLTGVDVNGAAVTGSSTTVASGAYSLAALPAGTYALSFSRTGYDPEQLISISISSGAVSAASVTLRVSSGNITGSVALSAGAVPGFEVGTDFSGVVVTLTGTDVPVPAAITDASGSYRFTGVPVSLSGAQFTVSASKPYFLPASTAVTAVANGTVAVAQTLSLAVNAAALAGVARLYDNVGGGGFNSSSAGISVSVTGTAFNGNSFSASGSSDANGEWSIGPLPPGSFQALATSANRTCGAYSTTTVAPGASAGAGSVSCVDALAPGPLVLGTPIASGGAQPGYTSATGVTVPVVTEATDPTAPASNFRGYQLALGASPDWSSATLIPGHTSSLSFTGLPANARTLLSARAVDWVGNAGPAAAVEVIHDDVPPPAPQLSTPRPIVDATTTSVTASGSESDVNFLGYEQCTGSVAAAAGCPVSAGCAFAGVARTFAVSLGAEAKTCVYARAIDKAGNASGATLAEIVSDLTPPSPPQFVPSYDPTSVSVRAPWVDFFVAAAATDEPAGGGAPWRNVAFIEVDTGGGFAALCAQPACHSSGTYSPCTCGCADSRLLCNGPQFVGVRAPLTEGTSTTVAFRAVDLAGNAGDGIAQQVQADATGDIIDATSGSEDKPRLNGTLLTFLQGQFLGAVVAVDLGRNGRFDPSDPRCTLLGESEGGVKSVFPASSSLVLATKCPGVRWFRAGQDGAFCTADDTRGTLPAQPHNCADAVSGAGERIAWNESDASGSGANVYVREAGADGLVGTADDLQTVFPFNHVDSSGTGLVLTDNALLLNADSCDPECSRFRWRVINPGPGGSYASGSTSFELPSIVQVAALSRDGLQLASIDSGVDGGQSQLVVRNSGADRRFGTADDAVVSLVPPWDVGQSEIVIDGPHVVVVLNGEPLNGEPLSYFVHWWAGPDGAFGTGDDELERIRPSGQKRYNATLSGSYLVYSQGSDLLGLDLSTLRWEVAPVGSLSPQVASELLTDDRGTLFYAPRPGPVIARAHGVETRGPVPGVRNMSTNFVAEGDQFVSVSADGTLYVLNPDPAGAWFTDGAPAAVGIYKVDQAYMIQQYAIGGGKLAVDELVAGAHRVRVFEPNEGRLREFPAVGTIVDIYPSVSPAALAITSNQVFFNAVLGVQLMVYDAGPDGRFGTADDIAATPLIHPAGSPRAGLAVAGVGAMAISGNRMILNENFPPTVYLFDAGPDGRFNTPDDVGRKLAEVVAGLGDIAIAGEFAAFFDTGSSLGRQVELVHGFDGPIITLTNHYSAKSSLALESTGRVFWVDDLFAPPGIFVRAP